MSLKNILEAHPAWSAVQKLKTELLSRGYLCYLAGGCVRDAILGRRALDLDVATDCLPDVLENLFSRTVAVGKSFGVIRVLIDGFEIEVATFRTERGYTDGRHPSEIQFAGPHEDVLRRDFTMNALYFDLDRQVLVDEVQGVADIQNQIIRTVGDPKDRFEEDYLRILRGLRFVSQLDFQIERHTLEVIQEKVGLVKKVSPERFRDEWLKLLKGVSVEKAFQLCHDVGFFKIYFPELIEPVSWPYKEWIQTEVFVENWKYWALFLTRLFLTPNRVQSFLKDLKLSRKEMVELKSFYQAYHHADAFLKQSLGQIIASFSVEGSYWGFLVYTATPIDSVSVKKIEQEKKNRTHSKKMEGPSFSTSSASSERQ